MIPSVKIPQAGDLEELRRHVEKAFNDVIRAANAAPTRVELDMEEHRISNVAWPTEYHDAVNVEYLEQFIQPVRRKISTSTAAAGSPGAFTFTPYVSDYGTIGIKDCSLSGNGDTLHIIAAYVDEPTTPYLYGICLGSITATTDPLTMTATVVAQTATTITSTFTDIFAANDYVVFDNTGQDATNTAYRSYEVMKITAVSGDQPGTATFTMTRQLSGAAAGLSQLKSYMVAHDAGIKFYKLHFAHWPIAAENADTYHVIKDQDFPLPSACVVAVVGVAQDLGVIGNPTIVNCSQLAYPFPGDDYQRPSAPGFRTCNGASYIIPITGPIAQRSVCPNFAWVSESASIRGNFATSRVRPQGYSTPYEGFLRTVLTAACGGYVVYIEPKTPAISHEDRRIAVVEQFDIIDGQQDSFSGNLVQQYAPLLRRTPFNLKWPCVLLPVVGSLGDIFDLATGQVRDNVLPFTATGQSIQFLEGGELTVIVERSGLDAIGSDLNVSLLT